MKLYLVHIDMPYEGSTVLGIACTFERALGIAIQAKSLNDENLGITEYELDVCYNKTDTRYINNKRSAE